MQEDEPVGYPEDENDEQFSVSLDGSLVSVQAASAEDALYRAIDRTYNNHSVLTSNQLGDRCWQITIGHGIGNHTSVVDHVFVATVS